MSNPPPQDLASMEGLLGQAVWLQRCALRMGYRYESAEDAVQETLLQSSLLASQSESVGVGWLRRTLQRRLGMQLRSDDRRVHREALTARPEAQDLDPAGPLEQLELQQEIQRAIAQLPRQDREVLALRFVAELSVQEIAESLGQTPNAVSSRLSRAVKRLRTILSPDDEPKASHGWMASLVNAGAVTSYPLIAGLAILMKKSLLALLVLTLVVLGTLTLPKDPPSQLPLERDTIAASEEDPASLQEPASEVQLHQPAPNSAFDSRTALAGEEDPAALEEVAVTPPLVPGALRVLCQEEGSAKPVAGMTIELLRKERGVVSFGGYVVERTNERGEALFAEVTPGTVSAILTRFGGTRGRNVATVEVVAGETAEIQFEVDPKLEMRGIVVDESGQPVPGAELWIGHRPGAVETGYRVGKSGPDGKFMVKYVEEQQFVCARAKGYAPSLSASPSFATNYAAQGLRLVLGTRHGGLHGAVRSPAGEPLVGALVSIGDMTGSAPGPGYYWTPIPQRQRTDAEGSFEFSELRTGEVSVRARAPGAAPWVGSVSIVDGSAIELVIELSEGGSLVGQVRTAQGDPAPGARVAAFAGEDATIPQAKTQTDEEGRYRLSPVSAGEMILVAEDATKSVIHREALYIGDGVERTWNPVLSTAKNLGGRVMSESGVPLKGWYVAVWAIVDGAPAANSSGATVGTDGSFAAEPEPSETYAIRIYPPGRFFGPEALFVESFAPQGEGPTFVVPDEKVPSASVRGQLVTEDGDAIAGQVTLTVATTPATTVRQSTSPDGHFRFDFLPEGPFTLTLKQGGRDPREIPSVGPLHRDEDRDLGRITP